MFEAIEEYANGGMEILIQDFLNDYITYRGEEPRLIASSKDGIPIKLLTYLVSECPDFN